MGKKGKSNTRQLTTMRQFGVFPSVDWIDGFGNGQTSRFLPVADGSFADIVDLIRPQDGEPWGHIPDCLAPYPSDVNIAAGVIVVPTGTRSAGYIHTREKHAQKIADFHGGMSVDDYLYDVLRHFQEIYRQADGSLMLLKVNGTRKCAIVAPTMINGQLVYKLITAYPLPRKPDFGKRRAVRLIYR